MNNNHQLKLNSCYCAKKESVPDIIHGRITGYKFTSFRRRTND